jgi:hypothetical protein
VVELQQADDVVAALNYLKSQPFVDPARIAISGCSYGGIQTLLTGEHDLGVMALVPFAPGAMSSKQNGPLPRSAYSWGGSRQGTRFSDPGRERLQSGSKPSLEQGSKQEEGLSIKNLSSIRQDSSGWALGILLVSHRCRGNDVLAFFETHTKVSP